MIMNCELFRNLFRCHTLSLVRSSIKKKEKKKRFLGNHYRQHSFKTSPELCKINHLKILYETTGSTGISPCLYSKLAD